MALFLSCRLRNLAQCIGVLACFVAGPRAVAAAPGYQLTVQEEAVVSVFAADEVRAWAEGEDTILGANFKRVTASTLSKDYDDNEVSADTAYKEQRLLVVGTVAAITKDAFGNPFVALKGHAPMMDVQAKFSKDSVGLLAPLKKGQDVKLWCDGAGRILTFETLTTCAVLNDRARAVIAEALVEHVKGALRNGPATSVDQELAIWAMTTSRLLPEKNHCTATPSAAICVKEVEQASAKKGAQFSDAMVGVVKALHDAVVSWVKREGLESLFKKKSVK